MKRAFCKVLCDLIAIARGKCPRNSPYFISRESLEVFPSCLELLMIRDMVVDKGPKDAQLSSQE